MDKRLQWLTVFSLTLAMTSAAPAEWREYRVSARYSGLKSWSLPEDKKYLDRSKLEANLKNGFKAKSSLQVYVSKDYIELAEPGPDWQNASLLPRTHGWNETTYFNAVSKLGTVGTKVTLEQHIPLGQRRLLASEDPPLVVFKELRDKGRSVSNGIADINQLGTQKVVVEGDGLADYFFAGGSWIKIALHRLLPDGSLQFVRLRPDGSTVVVQNWSRPKPLLDREKPVPLWERWELGASVRDVRVPGIGTPIRWQGLDAEPEPIDSQTSGGTSIKLAWMIPGAALFALGIGLAAAGTLSRQRPG